MSLVSVLRVNGTIIRTICDTRHFYQMGNNQMTTSKYQKLLTLNQRLQNCLIPKPRLILTHPKHRPNPFGYMIFSSSDSDFEVVRARDQCSRDGRHFTKLLKKL